MIAFVMMTKHFENCYRSISRYKLN